MNGEGDGYVTSKIYDERGDFEFDIVHFSYLDDNLPRRPSYGVYIAKFIRFARVFSHVNVSNSIIGVLSLERLFFQILSSTPRIGFKNQCRIKIYFTSRPIGASILR